MKITVAACLRCFLTSKAVSTTLVPTMDSTYWRVTSPVCMISDRRLIEAAVGAEVPPEGIACPRHPSTMADAHSSTMKNLAEREPAGVEKMSREVISLQ